METSVNCGAARRRLLAVFVSACLCGCLIEPNTLFDSGGRDGDHGVGTSETAGDPTTGDGDGDPTTGDPTTGDGDGDGDGDPTTGDGDDCSDLEAPGSDQCPGECTSCRGNVCVIECAGESQCEGQDIVCPQDYECEVTCEGTDACDTGSVTCPDLYACTLTCEGGNDACGDLPMSCGQGSCTINCGEASGVCKGASIKCGAGACSATCLDPTQPPSMPGCDAACSCSPC
ncbi:Xanthine dehydrogenase, molybdenum binding subunit [Enhygromyxa salina]|uniref:Xanthine dehydrogenase, molybdenum binding subunit n=1 Tax=Enhygromyxa salina TaxID=215803 RepID=A0A0C2D7X8_9BACT|nr:hypothetical protein [Enhygromyxa salina]KIG19206.1 Xanthine dehydrogenase, molybdenum binding subunit [Enhygromyxa salina]